MAKVGAQRAAELTGRSKSTIQRAMKTGKISYEVDTNDRRVIDVAELERAFGLVPQESERKEPSSVEAEIEKATQMLEVERLKMRVRMLEDQLDITKEHLDDIKSQRDEWQKQAQQVLLTSQYSQKQAEELKEQLRERERRAKLRRQQEMERRGQIFRERPANAQAAPVNKTQPGPIEKIKQGAAAAATSLDIQDLWKKIRGPQAKTGT